MSSGGCSFGLLGTIEVRAGTTRLNVGPPKQRLVLAVLLLAANQLVPLERLVDLTWPDSPPPTARTAIHGRISQLRALLATPGLDAELLSEGSGYRLRVDPDLVDSHRFTTLVGQAHAAVSDTHAVELYEQALGLWRGRPLDGTASEDVRRRLCGNIEETRLRALDDLTDAQLRLGRHRELVGRLALRLSADPVRERTARQLAVALYRCDQAEQAMRVCRRTRQRMHDELGVDPSPALAALETAILRDDPSLAAAVRPWRAWTVPAHLPRDVAGFVGRVDEVRRLTELLSGHTPALVSGPAGAGKSALSIHCGHRVAGQYPDGQLFVNLRGYDLHEPVRPVEALAGFLRALGVAPGQVPSGLDEAVLLYRSLMASRRILVVLDNAGSAEQVRPLLPGAASCAVVITSREELLGLVALDGARSMRLDVLSPAESLAVLHTVVGAERLGREPAATAALAKLCGHFPLALRIAGAHLAGHASRTVDAYVRDLANDRIRKLAIPEDPRAAVGAAFDLSYRALPPHQRRLFRLLGLVPGPDFTAATAAALTGRRTDETEKDLGRLDTAHLLRRRDAGRYVFHDLLRVYAAERAEAEEPPTSRETSTRHLYDHYLHRVEAAARLLYPHRIRLPLPPPPPDLVTADLSDSAAASRWLEAELPNLTAAIHHASDTGHTRYAGLLADALRGYFPGRGNTPERFAVAATALRAAAAEDDPMLATSAHLSFADAHQELAQYASAIEHGTAARTHAMRCGWTEGESTALGRLGAAHGESGELHDAVAHFRAALEINTRLGSRHKQVLDLMHLGVFHAMLGDLAEAAELFGRAHNMGERFSSPGNTAMVLQCLGNVHRYLGRPAEAVDYLTQALAISRTINEIGTQAGILDSLAGTHTDAGRHHEALPPAKEALELAQRAGARRTEVAALTTLATLHHAQGRHRESVQQHRQALDLATRLGYLTGELDALIGTAHAHTALGDHNTAEKTAIHGLALARKRSHRLQEGQALTALADNALATGATRAAADLAREALTIHTTTGYRLGEARTLRTLGHATRELADTTAALPHWQAAIALFTEISTPEAEELRAFIL